MLRRVAALTLGLALLAPLPATAAPDGASSDVRGATATTKSRDVSLGHTPVRASSRDRVRLTFTGRKGRLVNLARLADSETCGARTLRTRGGAVVKPWAQGYWRLPRTTTYTVVSKPCTRLPEQRLRLQVRRVAITAPLQPGATSDPRSDAVHAGTSTSVTHLMPFRVGDDERAFLSPTKSAIALIHPDRSTTRDIAMVRDVYAVRDYPGPPRLDIPSPVGRYFVEVQPSTYVDFFVSSLQTTTVDGPSVLIPGGPGYGDLVFTGEAGTWVYAELTSATGGPLVGPARRASLLDVFGESVAFVTVECPAGSGQSYCQVVLLPSSGTYVMHLSSNVAEGASMRVRTAHRTTAAATNGGPVTYASTSPGQWVIGELPEQPRTASGTSGATLAVTHVSTSLTGWAMTAASGYGPCNSYPCEEVITPGAVTLDATHMTAEMPWDALQHSSLAILAVPAAVTGSLDLAVTRPPQQQP